MDRSAQPLGHPLRRDPDRNPERRGNGLSAPARARPCPQPLDRSLPRQHRRAEAAGCHGRDLRLCLRVVPRRNGTGRFRHCGPVHRPHLRAREILLRDRVRGACLCGASDVSALERRLRNSGTQCGHHRPQGRHLSRNGRATILHARGIQHVPQQLGGGCHRHDQHARGQTRPRG